MSTAAAFAPPSLAFPPVKRRRSVFRLGGAWKGRSPPPAAAACMPEIAGEGGKKGGFGSLPNSNYVVPLDKAALGIIRPLGEILRDLNKKVTDNIVNKMDRSIPWYHVNRLLSFYAPGWCGEIRNVVFSDDGTVTVVYRITVRGIDGEAHRESSGSAAFGEGAEGDAVSRAEQIAFCKACARFGLGLYLYHEDDNL